MALSRTAVTSKDGTASSGVATSNSFSPPAGSMVTVQVVWTYAAAEAGATVTCKDSLGNVYTSKQQLLNSFSEILVANFEYQYASAETSITVTVTSSSTSTATYLISPSIWTGQSTTQTSPGGATADPAGTEATCEISVTTTVTGSSVIITGGTTYGSTPTVISGTTAITAYSGQNEGMTAVATSLTGTPGATNFGWTLSPSSSYGYCIAALEVLPASSTTPVTQADTAGAADVLTASAAAPQTDTASAIDTLAVQAASSVADTAGAADTLAAAAAAPAVDSAAAVDILAVTVVTPSADTAAAVDILAVTAETLPAADTAGAADSLAVSAAEPVSDVASAAEQLVPGVSAPAVDTGGAADTLAVQAAAPVADTGGAVDSMVVGLGVSPGDVAGAADSMAISTPAPAADTGGAADSISVSASVSLADSAGAFDTAFNATPQPRDTAGAADALSVLAAEPAADVAGAKDTLAVTAETIPVQDPAGAVDVLAVLATAPASDVAGAADSIFVTGGGGNPPDAAGAVDALAVAAAESAADVAGAKDTLAVPSVGLPLADIAGAKDTLVVAAAEPASDAAGAADQLSVTAALPAADVAGAADSFAVTSQTRSAADAAGAKDTLAVTGINVVMSDRAGALDIPVAGSSGAGASSFVSTLPVSVTYFNNSPGYQGGPSGAGAITPTAQGNGWEIYVRDSADYATLLAIIPQPMLLSFQFARQLDDIGSGTVILSQDAPWWAEVTLPNGQQADYILNAECLWQFYKDGVCRFEFLGETITEQLVDPSEQRQVTITGPGTMAALKWAMVAPQGFPDIVLKLDGILDSFDEVDDNGNGVVDTNIWTTLSPVADIYTTPIAVLYNYPGGAGYAISTLYPSGSMTIEASTATTFLGASPYDATDTLISAQVTPIGVSSTTTDSTTAAAYGAGLNGSELTQFYIQSNKNSGDYAMFGLSASAFYVQLASNGDQVTKVLPAYDSDNHAYWMITEQGGSGGGSGTFYFWTAPDGETWTLQWTYVHDWDATNVTFFTSAYYSVNGTESVQLSNLNSNVTTPSYQGPIYLGYPMMGIWLDQFNQAQARGTIPFVTSGITAAGDTYGRAWTDSQNVQATNGTDMYSFLQAAASVVNADYVMNPGFQLVVGQPATGEVALGVDRSGYLVLREGYDSATKGRVRARDQIQTLIGGENSDGHEISASSPTYIEQWGQREGWFQAAAQVDPVSMAYATAASLGQNETEVLSWTFNIIPNLPGKTIFDNFDVGDWLAIELPDFSGTQDVRVVGIAVQVDSDGNETHELTFVSYMQWLAEQLQYIANKLGGSFVNTQGTTPVAPSKYGTGQVPTYFTPAATLSSLADVSGTSAASTSTSAPLVYNAATGTYQAAGSTDPVTGAEVPSVVSSAAGSTTQTSTGIVVNTGNGSTVVGLQPDGTVTTVDSGAAAPSVPDAPTVAGIVQALQVTWDGLLSGAKPLSNFLFVQVYVGTTSGFTPSSANLAGTMSSAGIMTISGLTAGSTYYVKLTAVNTSGSVSSATTGVAGTPTGMPTSVLTGQLPASLIGNSAGTALNPNPYFNGGSLTGWTAVNGSLSATAPPSGAPGAAQYAAKVVSSAANCYINGSSAPFPVVAGQPYAMTAWVYNPGGSSVVVQVGFNWSGGTSTATVGPGNWVPVTTVQTCPGGVTSAYQVIGPAASGVTIYVVGAVATGQVPGQVIAAGSIVGNQLAANTVTASQIAANTITATQIAANTITAAQIQASTITAAQIAASTITASQIAAGTITATQIAANTITAAQINAGTVVAGIVNGTTITGASIVADGSSGEILVYSGTPGTGNLVMSVSAVAGSDAFSNDYSSGTWVYGSSGAVGLVPDGANTGLMFTPGSATPTAVAGSAVMYGTGSGGVNIVDGDDGAVYSVGQRLIGTSSGQTINSTTMATFLQSPVGVRSYRIHAQILVTGGGGDTAWQFVGPTGSGLCTFTWYEGATVNSLGAKSSGSNVSTTSWTSGTVYVMVIDGYVSFTAAGTFLLQACYPTGGSNFSIDANSYLEMQPV